MQHDFFRHISKIHIIKDNIPGQFCISNRTVLLVRMLPCPDAGTPAARHFYNLSALLFRIDKRYIAFIRLRLLIQQLKHTFRTRDRHNYRVQLHADLADRLVKTAVKRQKARQLPDGKSACPAHRQNPADNRAQNIADVAQLPDHRHQHICKAVRLISAFKQLVIEFLKIFDRLLFVTEHFNDFLPLHHFFDIAVYFAKILLLCQEILTA